MNVFAKMLGKNYAFEISGLHKICDLDTSLNLFNFDTACHFKGDHTPSFHIMLIIFNIKIFEFNIYNVHHEEDDEDWMDWGKCEHKVIKQVCMKCGMHMED